MARSRFCTLVPTCSSRRTRWYYLHAMKLYSFQGIRKSYHHIMLHKLLVSEYPPCSLPWKDDCKRIASITSSLGWKYSHEWEMKTFMIVQTRYIFKFHPVRLSNSLRNWCRWLSIHGRAIIDAPTTVSSECDNVKSLVMLLSVRTVCVLCFMWRIEEGLCSIMWWMMLSLLFWMPSENFIFCFMWGCL